MKTCCHCWPVSWSLLKSWTLTIWWVSLWGERPPFFKGKTSFLHRGYSNPYNEVQCILFCMLWVLGRGIQGSMHWLMCGCVEGAALLRFLPRVTNPSLVETHIQWFKVTENLTGSLKLQVWWACALCSLRFLFLSDKWNWCGLLPL